MERVAYGAHPDQYAEWRRPAVRPRGSVVVIHGGFWKPEYTAELGAPTAEDLTSRGWSTLNVEYRRVGGGGGVPATLDDVHAAINLVRAPGPIISLGHSAGGQLALWAASRARHDRWAGGTELTHVIAQAAVSDLRAAHEQDLGGGAVTRFAGDQETIADPTPQIPLSQPVWCVHARDDEDVPFEQSTSYVERARHAAAAADLVEVDGGHFELISPGTSAWARIVGILDAISAPSS